MNDANAVGPGNAFAPIIDLAQQGLAYAVVAAIVLGICSVIAVTLKKRSSGGRDRQYPYERHDSLVTQAERKFFHTLEQAVGDRYRVLAMVRVADVVKPERNLAQAARQSAFNRISSKHFDFLICEHSSLRIVAAVELDDASHRAPKRRKRDDLLERACDNAGLPLIREATKKRYDPGDLRARILAAAGDTSTEAVEAPEATREPAIGDPTSTDESEATNGPIIDGPTSAR